MPNAGASKPIASIQPVSVNNSNTNGTGVDTKGFGYALGRFYVGVTTGNIDVLKVQESNDDSTYADITGASFTALPGATDDNKVWTINIDLRGRQRYLRWHASEDNTGSAVVAGTFELLRADEAGGDSTFYGSDSHLDV